MPTSKHRRKPGEECPLGSPLRVEARFDRLERVIAGPFHRQFGHDHPAGFMLDLALEFLVNSPHASRAAVTAEFLAPAREETAAQQADEAWTLLVAQQIVTVDGDTVALHPRFAAS